MVRVRHELIDNLMYFLRTLVVFLPLFLMMFITQVGSPIYYFSLVFLILSGVILFFVFMKSYNTLLLLPLIFIYMLVIGVSLSGFWIHRISSPMVLVTILSILLLSFGISIMLFLSFHMGSSEEAIGDIEGEKVEKSVVSEDDGENTRREMSYLESKLSAIGSDVKELIERKFELIQGSLEQRRRKLDEMHSEHVALMAKLSEILDLYLSMKNRLLYAIEPIDKMLSLLEKYSETIASLTLSTEKMNYFPISPNYVSVSMSLVSDIRDKSKRFELALESTASLVGKLESPGEINLPALVFSIKPSVLEFVRIHYNSYVVSLKTVQIANTSGSSVVRKSLLAIIQDIDSLSFKLNVQLTNMLQTFSDFEPHISIFEAKIKEDIKTLTRLKSYARKIRDIFYTSVHKKLPVFEERYISISKVLMSDEFSQDVKDVKDNVEQYAKEFERLKALILSIYSDFSNMKKDILRAAGEIDRIVSRIEEYETVGYGIIKDIEDIKKQLTGIPRVVLTSKRILEDVNRFLSSRLQTSQL